MKGKYSSPDAKQSGEIATSIAAEPPLVPKFDIDKSYDGKDLPDVDLEALAERILSSLGDLAP